MLKSSSENFICREAGIKKHLYSSITIPGIMCAPQEQFKFKFTGIVDNPYDNKQEDIQTHHHHHCQPKIQSQKRQHGIKNFYKYWHWLAQQMPIESK
jgi:hypothetical protein